jgi:hypothetical protein
MHRLKFGRVGGTGKLDFGFLMLKDSTMPDILAMV